MRAVLLDDEYYALEGLRMELAGIPGIEVVGAFDEIGPFLSEMPALRPDILFLDIEMPGASGFEVLDLLAGQDGPLPAVVFVTAYDHYAVKAFEVNAADYIVKPVTRDRLARTLARLAADPAAVRADLPKAAPLWAPDRPEANQIAPGRPEEGQIAPELRIRCFGSFSITAGGREINAGWRTRKAEELVAYLLCASGRFVAKERIAEELWPEQPGDKSLANLYLAIYYIKKQAEKWGADLHLASERGKLRICLERIDCDLASFDRLLAEAEEERPEGEGPEGRIACYEKAAALYRGMLFEDAYYPWLDAIQQQYEVKADRIFSALVRHYRAAGDDLLANRYAARSAAEE